MIGKAEWFTYRIFGWGLRPRTWQGWAYIGVAAALVLLAGVLPVDDLAKGVIISIVGGMLVVDTLHMMLKLPKVLDERERYHELVVERNVSWAAVASIVIVGIVQSIGYTGSGLPFDTSLLVVLGCMLAVKIASWAYVRSFR